MIFGVSTGETGQYGVGDLVMGEKSDVTSDGDVGWLISGEPVYGVYEVVDGKPELCDVRDF